MSRPWMPLYIADYLADTAHLNAAESGAYLHLIMHYWQHGGLPDDDVLLGRIAKMTAEQFSNSRALLKQFFFDDWKHARIEHELKEAEAAYSRRATAGRAGGLAKSVKKASNAKPKLENEPSIAVAMLKQSQPHTDSPAAARARDFESECRKKVGQEPVVVALDFHEITAIVGSEITQADVLAGIDAAMADPGFRPRHWKQLVGWARRATKDRLAIGAKHVGDAPARAGPNGKHFSSSPPPERDVHAAAQRLVDRVESGEIAFAEPPKSYAVVLAERRDQSRADPARLLPKG